MPLNQEDINEIMQPLGGHSTPTPDDFYDHARDEIELQLRDNTKVAEAISFKEGKALAQKIALGVTAIYRRAVNAPD